MERRIDDPVLGDVTDTIPSGIGVECITLCIGELAPNLIYSTRVLTRSVPLGTFFVLPFL